VDVISTYTKTGIIRQQYANPVKSVELTNGTIVLVLIAVPLCGYIVTGIIRQQYANPVKKSVRPNGMKQRAKVAADQ